MLVLAYTEDLSLIALLCQQCTLYQRLVHAVGGVPSHAGYQVRVAIKSHGYAGMPQNMLNQFRVNAAL